MSIGKKIRRARRLRGYTQAELGSMVKLPGDMIRKYENDIRTPKSENRQKIADALEINISSLSNINITNMVDIMHILFGFEEQLGMNIEQKDGRISLNFNDSNKEIEELISYLNIWYNRKKSMSTPDVGKQIPSDIKNKYEIWKLRFPLDK